MTFFMVAAVRQMVKVEANGRIEILAPELRAGTMTEVIVLLPAEAPAVSPQERILALASLRANIGLTLQAADDWVRQIRDEREAWNPPAAK